MPPGCRKKPFGLTDGYPGGLNLILAMKITAILLIVGIVQVSASSFAQKVTINEKNVPLAQVFKQIRVQSGYKILIDGALLKQTKPVSVSVKNASPEEALDIVLENQGLEYEIKEQVIVIKKKPIIQQVPEKVKPIRIKGRVTDKDNTPLPAVSVRVRGTNVGTVTDANGYYTIDAEPTGILVFSSVGFQTMEIKINNQTEIDFTLPELTAQLKEITIQTGYEAVRPERFVGAASVVDSTNLSRVTGPDLLTRLENQVNALLFNRAGGSTKLQLRGVSTIQGASDIAVSPTVNPLIILDNFPYSGTLSSINPNTIESISILKDAVAFSIWGARAGNGVIVIKSKQGQLNSRLSVNFSSNVQVLEKPNLGYYSKMKSSDFIDVERFLFDKGYFQFNFNSPQFITVSPVVEILNRRKNGLLTAEEAERQISELSKHSVLDDYDKYVLKNAVYIQNFLTINGGTEKMGYSLSFGADNNTTSVKGPGGRNRYTVNGNMSVKPLKRLQITAGINYSSEQTKADGPGFQINPGGGKSEIYPYAKLADENGQHLAVPKQYILSYADTVGRGKLLDWKYRPLDENEFVDTKQNTQWLQLNGSAKYDLLSWLSTSVTFQLGKQSTDLRTLNDLRTFYTRDLINQFTNPTTLKQVIPLGGILDKGSRILSNQNFRGQFNVDKTFKDHEIRGLVAGELSNQKLDDNTSRIYGYDGETISFANNLNFLDPFPLYFGGTGRIANTMTIVDRTDRFVSVLGNLYYTYLSRYSVYASARKDGSNILGVNTNNRWKPLWSAGARWNINNEPFLNANWMDALALRLTYGYAGNVNNTISAISTISHSSSNNIFGQRTGNLSTVSNPDLRWEEVRTINMGVDFSVLKNKISGSVDWYQKRSKDLISSVNVDKTLGIPSVTKNVANIKGNGLEVMLNTRNIDKAVRWSTTVNYSQAKSVVSEFFGNEIITPLTPTVRKGEIFGALYAYKWAGLNPETGAPRGYLKGNISEDYNGIFTDSASHQAYKGASFPLHYGNILNRIHYKGIELSFNISFKWDYYFRKPSIRYDRLFSGWVGHSDYELRWKQKGDELITNIPSMQYPINTNRENFYEFSEVNVEKGDHIRLQDVRLSYNWMNRTRSKAPIKSAEVYVYANSLNVFIWRASKSKYDPDFPAAQIPSLRNVSLGVKLGL